MIRRATVRDFQEVLSFAPMMMTQAMFEYDPHILAAEVLGTLQHGNAFVAVVNGEIVGTVGYEVAQAVWYSSERALLDRWIAVREGRRGSYIAGKLILSLENEAERLGVPFMPAVSGSQKYVPTFEGRYGKPVAVLFRKDH